VGAQGYTVRCYRKTPGDSDCHDVPAFGEDDLEGIVEQAGFLLLAYFNDQRRSPEQKPDTAHIEDERGQIVGRIRVVGPDKVERISN
jgi:hypothetical protein